MKKVCSLLFALFISLLSFSQITFSSSDMPVPPWTQRTVKDISPIPAVNFGTKGINQVYNFSNFTPEVYDTIYYNATTTQQQTTFNGADVAVTADSVNYLYTKTTSSVFDLRGIEGRFVSGGSIIQAPFSDPSELFTFSTGYGTTFSGTSALSKTVPGSDVGQNVYQVRLTTNSSFTDTVDGWGKVTTPIGSYKCLRKKRKETTTTLTEYKVFSFSPWATLSNTTATTVRYTYPTKETKGSVVTFEYDSLNNVTSVTWSLIPPAAPIANFGSASGGGGLVFFSDSTDGYPNTYSWTFGDGGTSSSPNPNHTYAANGAYYVCLTVSNAGGSTTHCDSVHVTGITTANNPPIAVTDTVTLLQGTSITIFHVGANDIDPDGDNFCMDTVWGSPYVTEYIGGSCDMVSIHPDSTFTGTDTAWYRICDNGLPSLCDTGMIIFTVTANPNLYPIAVNDAATVLQPNGTTVNVGANDSAPSGNGFCVTSIYPNTSGFFAIANCNNISFSPDSTFTGSDTVWYVICDNGFPTWCDTARLIVTSNANPALLPVASFTTSDANLFSCTSGIIAQSDYLLVNTSTNYDSTYWYLKVLQSPCAGDTADYWGDSLVLDPTQLAQQWSCPGFGSIEVCMFVSNQFGWDAKCDTVCNLIWEGISEIPLSNISLFPNPASNYLTIDMRNNNDEMTRNYSAIEIYNSLGAKMKAMGRKEHGEVVNIPVAELAQGMYVAAIIDSHGRRTLGRFTKE